MGIARKIEAANGALSMRNLPDRSCMFFAVIRVIKVAVQSDCLFRNFNLFARIFVVFHDSIFGYMGYEPCIKG